MDAELEATTTECNACPLNVRDSPKTAVHLWPKCPWIRLNIDYAELVDEVMLLVLIDVHSKCKETVLVQCATVEAITTALKQICLSRAAFTYRITWCSQ